MTLVRKLSWLFALAIAFFTITVPIVRAQTTSITNLQAPPIALVGRDVPVTLGVSWDGGSGHYLVVAIWDSVANNFAKGTASSSQDTCEQNTGQYSNVAACIYALTLPSGSDVITFHLKFDSSKTYILQADAVLEDSDTLTIPCILQTLPSCTITYVGSPFWDSRGFVIIVSETIILEVFTQTLQGLPISTNVTVDGITESTGRPHMKLAPGSHTIAVPSIVQVDNSTRLRFEQWGDGSIAATRTLNLQADTTLTANYVTQYSLTLVSHEASVNGAGWYDGGSSVSLSAPSTAPVNGTLGTLGAKWAFQGWYEDNKLMARTAVYSIVMDRPRTVAAYWTLDLGMSLIILAVVAVVAVSAVIAAYVVRYLSNRTSRESSVTSEEHR